MPRLSDCCVVILILLGSFACAGKGKHGENAQQPAQAVTASVARPEATAPSMMLLHLEPAPRARVRVGEPQPLPAEVPPAAAPGAQLPAMSLQQLDCAPSSTKAASEPEKPMPMPEEKKPLP